MRKNISKAVAATLVLGTLAPVASAFADTQSFSDTATLSAESQAAIADLVAKGIVNGTGNSQFSPQGSLTRAALAKILVLASKKTVDTTQTTSKYFSDVTGWAAPYVDAAKDAGFVNGTSATTFTPDANVSRQDAAKMMVAALGYAPEATPDLSKFSDAASIADYAKGYVSEAVKLNLVKGNTDGTFGPLTNATREQAALLAERFLATPAYVAPPVAQASISALSLNQIKITFPTAVDQTTAENEASYKIGDVSVDTIANAQAKLLSDGQTVLITLPTAYTQGTVKTVAVKDDSIQEDGTGKFVAGFSQDVTFNDTTAPTVSKVSVSGNKKLTVTFSEAVSASAAGNSTNYKLDGQSLSSFGGSVSVVTGFVGGDTYTNQVVLNFDAPLSAGNHTLTVGASTLAITDSASYTLAKSDQAFTVDNVTSEPQVTSVTGDVSGKVKVVFDHQIDSSTLTSAFTVAGTTKTGTLDSTDASGKTVVIDFGAGVVQEGANVLEIAPNQVADVWGNKVAPTATSNVRVSFTATKDTVAPTVTNVYPISETTFRVVFSEPINSVYRTNANFVLKDAAGNTIYGGTSASNAWNSITQGSDSSQVDLNLTAAQAAVLGQAQYTLTVQNVADPAGNVMTSTSKTFTTIDQTAPTLATGSNLLVNTTARTAKILFNEPMDPGSIGNLSNYLLARTGTSFSALSSSVAVSVASDNKSVTFTFPTTENVSGWVGAKFRVIGVKDAAGNVIAGGTQDTAAQTAASSANFPGIVSTSPTVQADSSKVTVTFNTDQTLDTVAKADFAYYGGVIGSSNGSAVAPVSAVRVGNTVTLTWTDAATMNALKAAADGISFATSHTFSGSTNADGAPLTTGTTAIYATDAVAPVLNTVTVKTNNTIEFAFNEALKDTAALYGNAFTVIVNGTVVPTYDIVPTLNSNKLTYTLSGTGFTSLTGAGDVVVKANSTNSIKDTSDNAFVPSSSQQAGLTVTDGNAPTLVSAAAIAPNEVALTFSEPVQFATTAAAFLGDVSATGLNLASATATINGSTVTITLDPSHVVATDYTASDLAISGGLTDVSTNAFAAVTGQTIADQDAPAVATGLTGSGSGVTIAASGTSSIVFSEALNSASKTAVETALTSGNSGTGVLTYSWSMDGKTLTINNSAAGAATLAASANVTANITDVAGNTTTGAVLVAK